MTTPAPARTARNPLDVELSVRVLEALDEVFAGWANEHGAEDAYERMAYQCETHALSLFLRYESAQTEAAISRARRAWARATEDRRRAQRAVKANDRAAIPALRLAAQAEAEARQAYLDAGGKPPTYRRDGR